MFPFSRVSNQKQPIFNDKYLYFFLKYYASFTDKNKNKNLDISGFFFSLLVGFKFKFPINLTIQLIVTTSKVEKLLVKNKHIIKLC